MGGCQGLRSSFWHASWLWVCPYRKGHMRAVWGLKPASQSRKGTDTPGTSADPESCRRLASTDVMSLGVVRPSKPFLYPARDPVGRGVCGWTRWTTGFSERNHIRSGLSPVGIDAVAVQNGHHFVGHQLQKHSYHHPVYCCRQIETGRMPFAWW